MMKFKIFVLLMATSISLLFANERNLTKCITHGQCQDGGTPQTGVKCFIVKTGIDSTGQTACALRCYSVLLGKYCQPIKGESFGYCKDELNDSTPNFNSNDPNRCDEAIESPF